MSAVRDPAATLRPKDVALEYFRSGSGWSTPRWPPAVFSPATRRGIARVFPR
jgi:hypothetical protein